MSYKVEIISKGHNLGEGPHWDIESQALYFVDSFGAKIFRYLPAENRLTECLVDKDIIPVSVIIPIEGTKDKFLVTIGRDIAEVTWDGESSTPQAVRVLQSVESDRPTNRLNDGKVDPTGRLWIGSMGAMQKDGTIDPKTGALYSFSKDLTPTKREVDITIANGLCWSSDLKTMYYIDTATRTVDVYDYNANTGDIRNRRVLFDLAKEPTIPETALPDGMTIDADGNLWVAVFGLGGVLHLDGKTGKLIKKIDIPSPLTTSVAFGGPNLDELYVVSAIFNMTPEDIKANPLAGATFKVTGLGVKGLPMQSIKL